MKEVTSAPCEPFKQVLIDAGVYKCTKEGREAFDKFIAYINEEF